MRRGLFISGLAMLAVALPVAPARADSTLTLTEPASGALVFGGEPTFAGDAGSDAGEATQVAVEVWSGSSPEGVPVNTYVAPVQDGHYSYTPSVALPDGQFTAETFQSSSPPSSAPAQSAPVTFTVDDDPASIALDAPAGEPVTTATPTLTGVAGTGAGDAATVQLLVFPGSGTDATPIRTPSGAVASDGSFSIAIAPALPDGDYTAVAIQSTPLGNAYSSPVSFELNAHPPDLTLLDPAAGAAYQRGARPVFGGEAGVAFDDDDVVTVTLYQGSTVSGRLLGTVRATSHDGGWQVTWGSALTLGRYTVEVTQGDLGGQLTRVVRSFSVVAQVPVIGPAVTATRSGLGVAVAVGCPAGAGTCTGDVLVLTRRTFQPVYGGPRGPLRVMFAAFDVPAGQQRTVSRPLMAQVRAALRDAGPQAVSVTVAWRSGSSRRLTRAVRTLVVR